jgi:hypothetical protein
MIYVRRRHSELYTCRAAYTLKGCSKVKDVLSCESDALVSVVSREE